MNMQQSGIYELLKMMDNVLEKSFSVIPNLWSLVKVKELESIIDRIYASLPSEVQEARAFLRRREELQIFTNLERDLGNLQQVVKIMNIQMISE